MIYTTGAGLTDLRMYDSSGREVAYLLVPNPPASPTWPAAAILPVAPVENGQIKTSGFEADLREAMLVDRFRVDGIAAPFPEARAPRRQRRSRALDAARRGGDGLRSSERAAAPHGNRIHAGTYRISASRGTTRAAAASRCQPRASRASWRPRFRRRR
jgi:hypothetical protein